MRHRRAGVHLSRTSAHRKALFSNLVAALFTNERIRTTDAKAKETRRLAERTITWARRVGDVLTKKPERRSTGRVGARRSRGADGAARGARSRRGAQAVRRAGASLPRRATAATRASSSWRSGPGDAAPMSLLELMPEDGGAAPKAEPPRTPAKAKGRRAPPRPRPRPAKAEAKGAEGLEAGRRSRQGPANEARPRPLSSKGRRGR